MIERITRRRVIPVVVLQHADDAIPLAEALLEGGLDVMEITFRTAAAAESIRRITDAFPEMLVGAGTILSPDQALEAHDAGATFALAPGLNPDVVIAAQNAGLAFSPGVMTPSEIERALGLGCNLLKFFPAAAAGGIPMIKALSGPYAHTGVRFIPTGGISATNMRVYLAVPVVAAIGGSWMVDPKLIAAKDWTTITTLTREAVELAKSS
ncbi:MAG: bifunctional 4-hydroxy-2-oxoglutarate aldolase/2-dehydro-3-deoxy-phosphogluconate aldolase [Luteolibacter sp.]|jgi:2-dehydro-3-deoxyphosphogluconate aldolase / (4S)-4-hydroxy-2-oxoglutarate aldolase